MNIKVAAFTVSEKSSNMINYKGSTQPLFLWENGLLPLWGSVVVLCFVVRYFVSILVLQSPCLGGERAGCFGKFVCLQFVIVVFLDHTHFLYLMCVVCV